MDVLVTIKNKEYQNKNEGARVATTLNIDFSNSPCVDPENFMRGGPTKMVIFGHRRGGVQPPKKSRNYLFLGKIFKFQGGGGPEPRSPPLDPRMQSRADNSAVKGRIWSKFELLRLSVLNKINLSLLI